MRQAQNQINKDNVFDFVVDAYSNNLGLSQIVYSTLLLHLHVLNHVVVPLCSLSNIGQDDGFLLVSLRRQS